MEIVNDPIFGEMKYVHRWLKEENIVFWEKDQQVKVVAKAYSMKPITKEQQQSYKYFKENLESISDETKKLVEGYISANNIWIMSGYKNLSEIVQLRTVMIKQNGEMILLCDCNWDTEEGIGISVFPKYEIAPQDYFL